MIILENKTIEKDIFDSIIRTVKTNFNKNNFSFDIDITDTVNIWCDNDKDKTVFIQTKDEDSYATFTKYDLDNVDETDIKESIEYQLNATGSENE